MNTLSVFDDEFRLPRIQFELGFNEKNCIITRGKKVIRQCEQLRRYQPVAFLLPANITLIAAFISYSAVRMNLKSPSSVSFNLTGDIQSEHKVYVRYYRIGALSSDIDEAERYFIASEIKFFNDLSKIIAEREEEIQGVISLEPIPRSER